MRRKNQHIFANVFAMRFKSDCTATDKDGILIVHYIKIAAGHSYDFPVDVEKATYFLVMLPRGDWKNIGWD